MHIKLLKFLPNRIQRDNIAQTIFLLAISSLPWSSFIFEAACLLLLVIALVPVQRTETSRASPTHFLIALYIVFIVLSILFSISLNASMDEFRKVWHILLFFAGGILTFSEKKVEMSFRLLSISAACATLPVFLATAEKNFATPHNAVTLGYLCVSASMSSALFFLTHEKRSNQWLWFIIMALNLVGVLILHLRLPIVLAGGGIVILATLMYQKKKSVQLIAVVAVFFLFLLPGVTVSRIQLTLTGYSESRFVIWNSAMTQLLHTPLFGYGPHTFNKLFPAAARALLDDKRVSSWQSDIFSTALDCGFQTLALLLLIFVLLFRKIASSNFLMKHEDAVPYDGTFFIISAGVIAIGSLVNNVLGDPRLGGFFWLMSGVFYHSRHD